MEYDPLQGEGDEDVDRTRRYGRVGCEGSRSCRSTSSATILWAREGPEPVRWPRESRDLGSHYGDMRW